jgi:two-component system NtrC family sensor kinase
LLARGIKAKVLINIALILLLAMGLIYVISALFLRQMMISDARQMGQRELQSIEQHLRRGNAAADLKGALKVCSALHLALREQSIDHFLIVDKQFQSICEGGGAREIIQALKKQVRQAVHKSQATDSPFDPTWNLVWMNYRYYLFAKAINFPNDALGGIGLAVSMHAANNEFYQKQKIILLYIAINTVLFGLIGFFRISNSFLRPIRRLVKLAEDYREDEELFFSVRIEDDELHKLSNALNQMMKRISNDRGRLKSTVHQLETTNTELIKAQNEILRAEKLAAVGRLSSGIAHEIGNPIGIVLGYLDLLKQSELSHEIRNDYICRAEAEITRIHTIIRKLLDLSRPIEGKLATVHVHALLEDLVHSVKPQPLMANIDIQQNFAAKDDTVLANPELLRQVFLNLLINSADAIKSVDQKFDSRISIQTHCAAPKVSADNGSDQLLIIDFEDNGPGIDKAHLDNVFDPFFTTKEPGKGTGLGLSVSFMIIEKIGGSMSAASTKGQGTTLTISLPLQTDQDLIGNQQTEKFIEGYA